MIHRLVLAILLSIVVSNNVSASDKPEIFVQLGHSDNVAAIVFSPDGKYLASGSPDKSVRIWEIDTGREIRTLKLDQPIVGHNSVKFSPDGKYALSVEPYDKTIKIWDVSTGKEISKISGIIESYLNCIFSPDSKYIVSAHEDVKDDGKDKIIRFFDIFTGRTITSVEARSMKSPPAMTGLSWRSALPLAKKMFSCMRAHLCSEI